MKIFKVKGSNPERFCIAYVDSKQSETKGYTMTTAFATEAELREQLKGSKSPAEMDAIIAEARASEA